MKIKILLGILAILILSSVLIACSDTTEEKPTPEIITPDSVDDLSDEDIVVADLDQELLSEDDVDIGDII